MDTTTGADAAPRFPELAGLPVTSATHRLVVDGEAVAFDESSRPGLGQSQHRRHLSKAAEITQVAATIPVSYVIFDLVWLNGRDVTRAAVSGAPRAAGRDGGGGRRLMVPSHQVGGGADLLQAATAQPLEDIVVKRNTSLAVPGKREPRVSAG